MPLRPIAERDLAMVRNWRNHPFVRLSMFSNQLIEESEHLEWFERESVNPEVRWLVHEDDTGKPDGAVYFTEYRPHQDMAFWGFYRDPKATGGSGTRLGMDGLDHAFDQLKLRKLNAEVLASNLRSIRLHERLGFQREGVFRDGHLADSGPVDVIRYGILESEWREQRPWVLARLEAGAHRTLPKRSDLQQYIVASCKDWHRPGFETLQRETPGDWTWVSSPSELMAALENRSPSYIFFLHWNWLVPKDVWSRHECVCFHMTDVPYGRGGSPLQNLIAAGHTETKLSALRMLAQMDAGPVYAKRPLHLNGRAEDIYLRAGALSFELISWIVDQKPEPLKQQGEPLTFKRRTPDQSVLPSRGELDKLYDHIRMLDAPGYPLAFIEHGAFRICFSNAELKNGILEARAKISKCQSTKGADT